MKGKLGRQLAWRKRRILNRLDKSKIGECERPVHTASNIQYELSDRKRGLAHGGIGAFHLMAKR